MIEAEAFAPTLPRLSILLAAASSAVDARAALALPASPIDATSTFALAAAVATVLVSSVTRSLRTFSVVSITSLAFPR
ncbi:MAG: hypothetical protein ABI843_09710 [Dokdonella sp.]